MFFLTFVSLLICSTYAEDVKIDGSVCRAEGGSCITMNSCKAAGSSWTFGKCAGNTFCCAGVAATGQFSGEQCRARGDDCITTSECAALGRTWQSGFCPGDTFCCASPKADPIPPVDATKCTAHGKSGACMTEAQCNGQAGLEPFEAQTGVSGCGSSQVCCAPQLTCNAYGNAGSCMHTRSCTRNGLESYASNGQVQGCNTISSADVKCCAKKGLEASATPSTSAGCAGLVFPIARGSLQEISVNWGFSRSSGRRCHAGLDLYTTGARTVVAMGNGVVTNIMRGWYRCSKGSIDAILVHHTTGALAGKTVNYGEIDPGTYSLSKGSSVKVGQKIGKASRCGMMHMELYTRHVTTTARWYPKTGRVKGSCESDSLSRLNGGLTNPKPVLSCLKPAGARLRHTRSFLLDPSEITDEDILKFQNDLEEDPSVDDEQNEVFAAEDAAALDSEIAGVVTVIIVALVLIVGLIVALLVIRRRRTTYINDESNDTATINMTSAYQCKHCGEGFDETETMLKHISAQH